MGYFSNGSEGESYQEHWCARCLHDNFEKGVYCPVWNLHLSFNRDGANDENHFLHVLIPRSKDGIGNERCKMFVDRGAISNLAIEQFEHSFLALP